MTIPLFSPKEWLSKKILNKFLGHVVQDELDSTNLSVNILKGEFSFSDIKLKPSIFEANGIIKVVSALVSKVFVSLTERKVNISGFKASVTLLNKSSLQRKKLVDTKVKTWTITAIINSALKDMFKSWQEVKNSFELFFSDVTLSFFEETTFNTNIFFKQLSIGQQFNNERKLNVSGIKIVFSDLSFIQIPSSSASVSKNCVTLVSSVISIDICPDIIFRINNILDLLSRSSLVSRHTSILASDDEYFDAISEQEVLTAARSQLDYIKLSTLSNDDQFSAMLEHLFSAFSVSFTCEAINTRIFWNDRTDFIELKVLSPSIDFVYLKRSVESIVRLKLRDFRILHDTNLVVFCRKSEGCAIEFALTRSDSLNSLNCMACIAPVDIRVQFSLLSLSKEYSNILSTKEPGLNQDHTRNNINFSLKFSIKRIGIQIPIPVDCEAKNFTYFKQTFNFAFVDISGLISNLKKKAELINIGTWMVFVSESTLSQVFFDNIVHSYRLLECLEQTSIHIDFGVLFDKSRNRNEVHVIEVDVNTINFSVNTKTAQRVFTIYSALQDTVFYLFNRTRHTIELPNNPKPSALSFGINLFSFQTEVYDGSELSPFATLSLENLLYVSQSDIGIVQGCIKGLRYKISGEAFHTILASTNDTSRTPNFLFKITALTASYTIYDVSIEALFLDLTVIFPLTVFQKFTKMFRMKEASTNQLSKRQQALNTKFSLKIENVEVLYFNLSISNQSLEFQYDDDEKNASLAGSGLRLSAYDREKETLINVASFVCKISFLEKKIKASVALVKLSLSQDLLLSVVKRIQDLSTHIHESMEYLEISSTYTRSASNSRQPSEETLTKEIDYRSLKTVTFESNATQPPSNIVDDLGTFETFSGDDGLKLLNSELDNWQKLSEEEISEYETIINLSAPKGKWLRDFEICENHLLQTVNVKERNTPVTNSLRLLGYDYFSCVDESNTWTVEVERIEAIDLQFSLSTRKRLVFSCENVSICVAFTTSSHFQRLGLSVENYSFYSFEELVRLDILTYWVRERLPRVTDSAMFTFVIDVVNESSTMEYSMHVALLNIKLHLNHHLLESIIYELRSTYQKLQEVLKPLYTVSRDSVTTNRTIFWSSITIKPWRISLTYLPKQFDYSKIKQGDVAELISLFTYENVKINLRQIEAVGIVGIQGVFELLKQSYLDDVIQEQLYQCIKGVRVGGNNQNASLVRTSTVKVLSRTGIEKSAKSMYRLLKRRTIKLVKTTHEEASNSLEYILEVPIRQKTKEKAKSILITLKTTSNQLLDTFQMVKPESQTQEFT